ncbi:MAG: MFS transporter, partial [Desulfobacterales bacterium]
LVSFALGMTMGQNNGFGDDLVRALLMLSGFGVLAFLMIEKRARQPMVDLDLFRDTQFSLNLVMGLISFIVMGGMFILPFYLQLARGYSTLQVGLMMMASPVAMGLMAPVSGSLSDRYGTRVISAIGLFFIVTGCYAVSTLTVDTSVTGYFLRVALVGVGMGIFQSPNNSAIMGAAPPEQLGVASGLMSLARNLGTTIGIPMMGAICTAIVITSAKLTSLTNIAEASAPALVAGINGTFRVAAAIMLVSALAFVIMLWVERRQVPNARG